MSNVKLILAPKRFYDADFITSGREVQVFGVLIIFRNMENFMDRWDGGEEALCFGHLEGGRVDKRA